MNQLRQAFRVDPMTGTVGPARIVLAAAAVAGGLFLGLRWTGLAGDLSLPGHTKTPGATAVLIKQDGGRERHARPGAAARPVEGTGRRSLNGRAQSTAARRNAPNPIGGRPGRPGTVKPPGDSGTSPTSPPASRPGTQPGGGST